MKKIYLQNLSVKEDELLLLLYHSAGAKYYWQLDKLRFDEKSIFIRRALRELSGKITIIAPRIFQEESELFDTVLSTKAQKIVSAVDRSLTVLDLLHSAEIAPCITPHINDLEKLYRNAPYLFQWLKRANLYKNGPL